MHTREHHSDTATDVSVAELLARYLRAMDGDCDSEPVDFWVRNNATYDKLIPAVRRTFAIPASSAPVERVFSYGGIVLRPNRARMSDKLLSELVFLKCDIVWTGLDVGRLDVGLCKIIKDGQINVIN